MKYVEQQGKRTFDWWGFLNKEDKTEKEKAAAVRLSSDLVTCGCGNKDCRIERDIHGKPEDDCLEFLGVYFFEHIVFENYETAKETLRRIDVRELELIKEYEENLKTKNDERNRSSKNH